MSDYFMNTYHRLPVTFTHGGGTYLFDGNGKRYLDFTSGIGVNCLGHAYPALVQAVSEQTAKCIHVSNYFQSAVTERFAQKLVEACSGAGMKRVFLGNSGAEANECAFKIARKYSLKKYGSGRYTIVTLRGSFHGRTITTLSATGQDRFHEEFGPFTEGFTYVPAGDIPALDRALDNTVAGLLIEAVQGENGVHLQDQAYIEAAARFCTERDILLMFDEIQCGVGRTGSFLACEGFGTVKPDVVTLAKALSGGIPAGAALAGERAADTLTIGDHGSTFGGNLLAAAAGLVVLETVNNAAFLREITRKGEKIRESIRSWNKPNIRDIRGKGLMIGIDITQDAWDVLEKALEKGLLLLAAGAKTLRFLPPYTIRDEEIESGLQILQEIV
ncbi:MAG: acetylornithine/succinylornithine family transaminase [Treponema sp.]|nr:acetylornithine/succinylornithine family transaminase [Treponema sp.]